MAGEDTKNPTTTTTTSSKLNKKSWQRVMYRYLDHPGTQLVMMLILLLSLFISDCWVLGNAPDSSNPVLYVIILVIFSLFVVESVLLSLVQPGYFMSFFFVMDVVGTFSLLFDVGWIFHVSATNTKVLRATRAARLGARYGRLLRLLKFIRFFKYFPCFSEADDGQLSQQAVKRLSNELSTLISQRVAFLILICVMVVPHLSYTAIDFSPNMWVDVLQNTCIESFPVGISQSYFEEFSSFIRQFYKNKDLKISSLSVYTPTNHFYVKYKTHDVVRSSNLNTYTSLYQYYNNTYQIQLEMDQTRGSQLDGLYSILIIVLVIVLLFGFASSFSAELTRIVVQPLEKMMETLRNQATSMMSSVKGIKKEVEKVKAQDGEESEIVDEFDDYEELEGEMETVVLETMIDKLVRIVNHIMPAEQKMEGADKDVIGFITQTFSLNQTTTTKQYQRVETKEEVAERMRSFTSQSLSIPLDHLNSWGFDVLKYKHEDLFEILSYLFTYINAFSDFKIKPTVFHHFMSEISKNYIAENTYHNFFHGVDVCHTVYRLVMVPQLNNVFPHLDFFALMVAALAHDVGHFGLNNMYLVKSKNPLALLHNDKSPLENMHCSLLYEIVSKTHCNIFEGLSEKEWRDTRLIVLKAILGTDMAHHSEQIKKTQLFLDMHGEEIKAYFRKETLSLDCLAETKDRIFVMELILHCADISNPYKTFPICKQWAELVVEEFFRQGDRETKEGLDVSPMCGRGTVNLYNMQMGFIEFAVAPLINTFVQLFPPNLEIAINMRNNFVNWGELRKAEIRADPALQAADKVATECESMDKRLNGFREKMNYISELAEFGPPHLTAPAANVQKPRRASIFQQGLEMLAHK